MADEEELECKYHGPLSLFHASCDDCFRVAVPVKRKDHVKLHGGRTIRRTKSHCVSSQAEVGLRPHVNRTADVQVCGKQMNCVQILGDNQPSTKLSCHFPSQDVDVKVPRSEVKYRTCSFVDDSETKKTLRAKFIYLYIFLHKLQLHGSQLVQNIATPKSFCRGRIFRELGYEISWIGDTVCDLKKKTSGQTDAHNRV